MNYLISFKTTQAAIMAESVLLQANINVKIMPLPSSIRAGCGICLRIENTQLEATEKCLSQVLNDQFEIHIINF